MIAVKPGLSSALAAGLALCCFLPTPSRAQTASCTSLPKPPDTLLKLAECCAASPAGNPSCRASDPKDGYVIIKDHDPSKPQAYLILPTVKVTGIEDPLVSKMPVVEFWQYGWSRSAQYPGHPPADRALAINSTLARTQNQLHIHMSCVRGDVKSKLLATPAPSYPSKPVALPLPPHQNIYQVVKVGGLGGPLSPFLLIQDNPAAKANMGGQGIAVVGSATANEYFVLSTHAQGSNPAEAEELLDESCP